MSEKCVRCETNPVVPGSMLCRACVAEIANRSIPVLSVDMSRVCGALINATEPCVCGHGKPMHAVPLSHGGDGLFHEGTPCIVLAPRERPTVEVARRCGCLSYRRPSLFQDGARIAEDAIRLGSEMSTKAKDHLEEQIDNESSPPASERRPLR